MNWESIRNNGKICEVYKKIPLETGKIKTGEFLYETLREFAKVSTAAFDNIGDYLFAYRERQLSSIFLPAFYNLGFSAMQETPTRRSADSGPENHGWLDYWVQKEGKWVYLIEAKHGWHCVNRPVSARNQRVIRSSVNQLQGINGAHLEALSFDHRTFKLALMVLPFYRTLKSSETTEANIEYTTPGEDLTSTIEQLSADIRGNASWIGVWSPPSRMQLTMPANQSGSRMLTYPGVALIASVVE